jgi:proteasome accessory factor A
MDEILFGMETELAFSALQSGASEPNQETLFELQGPLASAVSGAVLDSMAGDLMGLADQQIPSLRDMQANGLYFANGSRLYMDAGRHPEFCTPECRSPEELVRWQLAGEQMLARLVEELMKLRPDFSVALFRCNVDYGGSQNTWGCHESYQHRSSEDQMSKHLIPHLVSRIVYCGAGGLNNRVEQAQFLISPRVPHLVHAVGADSQRERSLYHTKNEPLGGEGFNRLHLICGESNCSQLATYLKFGTTALIVRLIDAGVCRGDELQFHRPLQAMNKFARDPECRAKRRVRKGGRLTAIEIQREYLAMVEEHLGADFMPDWAARVCERWRDVLDRLERDPSSLSTSLDWTIKHALFEDRIARSSSSWTDLTTGGGLGAELCEIDTRFGQLGQAGLFYRLDQAGVLDHRLTELGSVEDATSAPPPDGRAEVRGRAIRERHADPDRDRYKCCWHMIIDQDNGRVYDMSDPYGLSASWREPEKNMRTRRPRVELHRRLHSRMSRGSSLYRESMLTAAVEVLAPLAEDACSANEEEIEARTRFWCASAYHDSGRLQDAEDILAPILETVLGTVRDETACRVLTRYALVLIDRPAERSRVEAAIEQTRAYLEHASGRAGESRIGMVEARWQGALGQYDQAIETIKRALEAERSDMISFARSTYLRWLIYYLFRKGQVDRASSYLAQWRAHVEAGPFRYGSNVMLACAESMLARHQGNQEAALRHVRAAAPQPDQADPNRYLTAANCAVVESAVAVGDLETARSYVELLEGLGDFEIGEQRCDVLLARAAFYRAMGERVTLEGGELDGEKDRELFAGGSRDVEVWGRRGELAEEEACMKARGMDDCLGTEHHVREIGEGCRPVG